MVCLDANNVFSGIEHNLFINNLRDREKIIIRYIIEKFGTKQQEVEVSREEIKKLLIGNYGDLDRIATEIVALVKGKK